MSLDVPECITLITDQSVQYVVQVDNNKQLITLAFYYF